MGLKKGRPWFGRVLSCEPSWCVPPLPIARNSQGGPQVPVVIPMWTTRHSSTQLVSNSSMVPCSLSFFFFFPIGFSRRDGGSRSSLSRSTTYTSGVVGTFDATTSRESNS